MLKAIRAISIFLAVMAAPAHAYDMTARSAIGGGLGGALGSFIGAEVSGRTGAIIGSGIGAAAGTAVATYDYQQYYRGDSCPSGEWRRGRCVQRTYYED